MGRDPMNPDATSVVPTYFEQARGRYFAAVNAFILALEAEIRATIVRLSPDIVTVRVLGEYGESMDRVLRIQDAWDAGGVLIGSLDQAHEMEEGQQVDFETVCDEADPMLDWLLDLTGDDWMGTHELNVITGEIATVER